MVSLTARFYRIKRGYRCATTILRKLCADREFDAVKYLIEIPGFDLGELFRGDILKHVDMPTILKGVRGYRKNSVKKLRGQKQRFGSDDDDDMDTELYHFEASIIRRFWETIIKREHGAYLKYLVGGILKKRAVHLFELVLNLGVPEYAVLRYNTYWLQYVRYTSSLAGTYICFVNFLLFF
jgi:hypothetical protein